MTVFNGTSSSDFLVGGDDADQLNGNAGNDTLNAGGGNDTLNAGEGDDVLDGGPDNDLLFAGLQTNLFLFGLGDGQDTIDGGGVPDSASDNTLRFKAPISPERVSVRPSLLDFGSLVLEIHDTNDVIVIRNARGGRYPTTPIQSRLSTC